MVLESGTFSKGFQKVLVRCTSTSFCTELWRHTMPAQDEVAHNHTPHLFPPKADLLLPLGPGAGRFLLHDDASRVCHAACPRDATVAASKVG